LASRTGDPGWRGGGFETAPVRTTVISAVDATTLSVRHAKGDEMKIVVIGGRGLIGSKLVEKLREDGHDPGDNPRIAPTRFADRLSQSRARQTNPNVPPGRRSSS
jgi:hypothetical protein